jgi:hypothetical protein
VAPDSQPHQARRIDVRALPGQRHHTSGRRTQPSASASASSWTRNTSTPSGSALGLILFECIRAEIVTFRRTLLHFSPYTFKQNEARVQVKAPVHYFLRSITDSSRSSKPFSSPILSPVTYLYRSSLGSAARFKPFSLYRGYEIQLSGLVVDVTYIKLNRGAGAAINPTAPVPATRPSS